MQQQGHSLRSRSTIDQVCPSLASHLPLVLSSTIQCASLTCCVRSSCQIASTSRPHRCRPKPLSSAPYTKTLRSICRSAMTRSTPSAYDMRRVAAQPSSTRQHRYSFTSLGCDTASSRRSASDPTTSPPLEVACHHMPSVDVSMGARREVEERRPSGHDPVRQHPLLILRDPPLPSTFASLKGQPFERMSVGTHREHGSHDLVGRREPSLHCLI